MESCTDQSDQSEEMRRKTDRKDVQLNMGQKTIEREVQTNGFEDDFRMKWVSVQRIRIGTHFLFVKYYL